MDNTDNLEPVAEETISSNISIKLDYVQKYEDVKSLSLITSGVYTNFLKLYKEGETNAPLQFDKFIFEGTVLLNAAPDQEKEIPDVEITFYKSGEKMFSVTPQLEIGTFVKGLYFFHTPLTLEQLSVYQSDLKVEDVSDAMLKINLGVGGATHYVFGTEKNRRGAKSATVSATKSGGDGGFYRLIPGRE